MDVQDFRRAEHDRELFARHRGFSSADAMNRADETRARERCEKREREKREREEHKRRAVDAARIAFLAVRGIKVVRAARAG